MPEMAVMRGGIPAVFSERRRVPARMGRALGGESCGRGRSLVVRGIARRGQGAGLPETAVMRVGIPAVCGEWRRVPAHGDGPSPRGRERRPWEGGR